MEKKIMKILNNILVYMSKEIYVSCIERSVEEGIEDEYTFIIKSFIVDANSKQFTIKLSKDNFIIQYDLPSSGLFAVTSWNMAGDESYDKKDIDIETGKFEFVINDSVFNSYEKELRNMCEDYESVKFDSLVNNIYKDFKKERQIKIDKILEEDE